MDNMQTAAAIEIDPSFFAQLEKSTPDEDPRMVRWGYNPGLRSTMLPPRETGLKISFIPIGQFIAHTTFSTPQENCTLDEYKAKEFLVEVTAAEAQATFQRALSADPTSGRDWGYQSFGYGESDAVKVAGMNQILIPKLSEIRAIFGEHSPIRPECKGEDEMDLGDERTHCASCHLEWIKSAACKALMRDAVQNGRVLPVRTPDGGVREVSVRFTFDELEGVRKVVQLGLELYKRQAHADWSEVLNEHQNGTRDKIQDAEHFLRKDLHLPRPQNKDVALIEKVIDAQNRQQAAVVPDNSALFEQLVHGQTKLAEAIERTNDIVARMAVSQVSQPLPPVEAAPEKSANSKKEKGADSAK